MTSELSYFRHRASQERTAALHSLDARARLAHVTMAECYEEQVKSLAALGSFAARGREGWRAAIVDSDGLLASAGPSMTADQPA